MLNENSKQFVLLLIRLQKKKIQESRYTVYIKFSLSKE